MFMWKRKLILSAGCLLLPLALFAWPRLGYHSDGSFQDTGNKRTCFSVTVSSSTVVLLYSGDDGDRETIFQNTSDTYDVYIATHSAMNAINGSRMMLRKSNDLWTDNTGNLYARMQANGTSGSVEVIGCTEFDNKD